MPHTKLTSSLMDKDVFSVVQEAGIPMTLLQVLMKHNRENLRGMKRERKTLNKESC